MLSSSPAFESADIKLYSHMVVCMYIQGTNVKKDKCTHDKQDLVVHHEGIPQQLCK